MSSSEETVQAIVRQVTQLLTTNSDHWTLLANQPATTSADTSECWLVD